MTLPTVLAQSSQPMSGLTGALAPTGLPTHWGVAGPPPGGALADEANALTFAMETQSHSNWCWSAVATSVSKYYDGQASSWSQCKVVNAELGQLKCCADGSTPLCNRTWYLDRALKRVQRQVTWTSSYSTFNEIMAEVSAGNPLGVRIGWQAGSGHFLIIDGYAISNGATFVDVEDPLLGPSTYDYDQLKVKYNGTGSWTHTYFMQ